MLFCRVGPAPEPTGEKNPVKSGKARPRPWARAFRLSCGESLGKQDCCVWGGKKEGLLCLAVRLFFSVFFALFSRFPFSHCLRFFSRCSFLGFPFSISFHSPIPCLLGLFRFSFRFPVFLFSVAAWLGLGARSSLMARLARATQPKPGGAGFADARRARQALRRAARPVLFFPFARRAGGWGATSPHPIFRRAARILGSGRAIKPMRTAAPWEREARLCSTKRRAERHAAGAPSPRCFENVLEG